MAKPLWYRRFQVNDGIETLIDPNDEPVPAQPYCNHCDYHIDCRYNVFGQNGMALCELKLYSNVNGQEIAE